VLRGLGWLAAAQGVQQALQLSIRVLMVRLLAPLDFGLMGMVTVVIGFLLMIHDLGFGPALVRKEAVTEEELSTVFWLNLLTGCLLALTTAALGPALAWFYHQPQLSPVCLGLAFTSLFAPLGSVHTALLQRRFAFRSLAAIDILGLAVSGAVGVTLAAGGRGVWALVWQSNVNYFTVLLATVVLARWTPRFSLNPRAAAGMGRFSACLTASLVVNYWVRNLDNLLIGRFLGASALGLYSQAYQMMLYPIQNVTALVGRVLWPALAQIRAEPERLRRVYLRSLHGIAAITFPLMLGALVVASDLYSVLLGARWRPSVFLFQVLCPVGMLQSIGSTIGWIYMTTGRTDRLLRWNLIVACIILPGFGLSLIWGGLRGITIGYAVLAALLFVPSLLQPFRLIELQPAEAFHRLTPIVTAAAGMALTIAAFRWSALQQAAPVTRLIVELTLAAGVYASLLHWLRQAPITRVRTFWRVLRAGG
jgi:PST family polysaccharide transporter